MSRQSLGNAVAGVLFLAIAVWNFSHDTSGIGVVFLVFAAVFIGLAVSDTRGRSRGDDMGKGFTDD
jgi:hypothetical protein